MKSPAVYYLMLLYITVIIKPLIPIISDVWDHQFNEIEHILIVHAKYGSHHLEKELGNENTDNNKSKDQNTLRSEDPYPVHVLTEVCRYYLPVNNNIKKYFPFTLNYTSAYSLTIQGPPPKFFWNTSQFI